MPLLIVQPALKLIAAACETDGYADARFEYSFARPRKFRFDLAFPSWKVAFEKEGLGPKGREGRHQRISGFLSDLEKYNLAAGLGWYLVRASSDMIRDGRALVALLRVLNRRKAEQLRRPQWSKPADRVTPSLVGDRP